MPKKKDESKIVSMSQRAVVPPQFTQEEIAAIMKKEEEELDRYVNRFMAANPMPPTSGVEEQEDEEEEEFTLDLEKGIATQKIGEGVAVRDNNGNIKMLNEKEIEELKDVIAPTLDDQYVPLIAEPTPFEKEKNRFQDMITERMVSKALASLMKRLSKVQEDAEKLANNAGLGYLGERTGNGLYEAINKQKKEIRQAWNGVTVLYDKIPSWAMPWVEDYIQNGINTMMDFFERD